MEKDFILVLHAWIQLSPEVSRHLDPDDDVTVSLSSERERHLKPFLLVLILEQLAYVVKDDRGNHEILAELRINIAKHVTALRHQRDVLDEPTPASVMIASRSASSAIRLSELFEQDHSQQPPRDRH